MNTESSAIKMEYTDPLLNPNLSYSYDNLAIQ